MWNDDEIKQDYSTFPTKVSSKICERAMVNFHCCLSRFHTKYPLGKKCKKEANEEFFVRQFLGFYVKNKFKMSIHPIRNQIY